MRKFKTVLKYARDTGVQFLDPFVNLNTTMERTERGFLDQSDVDLIYNQEFTKESLSQVRDIFIFSCFTFLALMSISLYIN